MYRSGLASPRDAFLDQFEMDGGDWLYRHRMTGPAYRVPDLEKAAFVAAYDRHNRRFSWIVAAIYLAAVVVLFMPSILNARSSAFPEGPSWDALWILLLSSAAAQWIDDYFALGGPLKKFHQRAAVAPAWSREDRQRLSLQRLPLTVVVGTATITFLVLLYFALEEPAIGPKSIVLIVASVVGLAWAIVQGMRKWQFARRDYAANNLI